MRRKDSGTLAMGLAADILKQRAVEYVRANDALASLLATKEGSSFAEIVVSDIHNFKKLLTQTKQAHRALQQAALAFAVSETRRIKGDKTQ